VSAAALLVVGGSALWFWSSRVIVVALPWALLAMLSIAGHYVVPSFAAAVRSTEELTVSEIEADRGPLAHIAYGTTYTEMSLDPALAPEPRVTPSANAVFGRAPLWDAFAVTILLTGWRPRSRISRSPGRRSVCTDHDPESRSRSTSPPDRSTSLP